MTGILSHPYIYMCETVSNKAERSPQIGYGFKDTVSWLTSHVHKRNMKFRNWFINQ